MAETNHSPPEGADNPERPAVDAQDAACAEGLARDAEALFRGIEQARRTLGCDDAEIVALIWSARDDVRGIIRLLQGARVTSDAGRPIEALRDAADDADDAAAEDAPDA